MKEEKVRNLMYYWLQSLDQLSVSLRRRMVLEAGSPEELFRLRSGDLFLLGFTLSFLQAERFDLSKDPERIREEYDSLTEKGIRFCSEEEEDYPAELLELPDRPFGLFVRGKLPDPGKPNVSIVGARRCTNYGKDMAYYFGRELAAAGVNIVSGMALGIDGYSQRGALQGNGESYAVLAGGVDVCYPRENIDLYVRLGKQGGILSERSPGHHALPADFPVRNRIVSGLSRAVIVIEAAEHSGSLITVNQALSQNREVFALPGRVGDRMSSGCNELLKNGAQVLTSPEDVLQYLGLNVKKEEVRTRNLSLSHEERAICDLIGTDPVGMDQLLTVSGFPLSALNEILVRLEIRGAVKRTAGGYVRIQGMLQKD